MELAQRNDAASIAFACMSIGSKPFPDDLACRIMCSAVISWLNEHKDTKMDVYFCCPDPEVLKLYQAYFHDDEEDEETAEDPSDASEEENTASDEPEVPDIKTLEDAINDMMPGLTMYVRDADLSPECAAAYKPEMIIMERAFTDASNRVMGMNTTHRFAILSNHMADLRDDGDAGKWGLFVADHHSHFKVLDIYEFEGKTQILLLHYPDGDDWKLFGNTHLSVEDDLIESCRKRFEGKCRKRVIPELATEEWRARCEKPIGMDDEGNLYDLDEKPGKLDKKISDLEYAIIMNIIHNGMVNEPDKDMAFLRRKMEQYKTHPLGREIIKECARMLYELLPEDQRDELSSALAEDTNTIKDRLNQIRKLVGNGKLDEAKQLMDQLASEADLSPMFREDAVSKYFCFSEWFEECLYRHLYKPEKEVRRAQYPYDEIYLLQGILAVEMKDLETARTALEKAKQWAPMNTRVAFEYAETFKMEGDMKRFFEESKKIQKFAIHSKDVARFLRNACFYFGEIGQYEDAMVCVVRSAIYDRESKMAENELVWLHEKHGVDIPKLDAKACRKFADRYGFPLGADNDLLRLLYAYGKHFMDEKETDGARYCLGLLYELTEDDEIKGMIDSLPKVQ